MLTAPQAVFLKALLAVMLATAWWLRRELVSMGWLDSKDPYAGVTAAACAAALVSASQLTFMLIEWSFTWE